MALISPNNTLYFQPFSEYSKIQKARLFYLLLLSFHFLLKGLGHFLKILKSNLCVCTGNRLPIRIQDRSAHFSLFSESQHEESSRRFCRILGFMGRFFHEFLTPKALSHQHQNERKHYFF